MDTAVNKRADDNPGFLDQIMELHDLGSSKGTPMLSTTIYGSYHAPHEPPSVSRQGRQTRERSGGSLERQDVQRTT
jgi:hypothetical protein